MAATSVATETSPGGQRLPRSWPGRNGWDGPRRVAVGAAVVSAVLAVVVSGKVFSHLSVNNDESVYLLQAKALAAGHLFPPVGHPAASFTPWLGVIRGGHYVLKYVPVIAAFLAVSLLLTGGYVTALACWAAALAGTTFLLAKEATGSRPAAAAAAVLLAACPVTVVQSALVLPYVPFMVFAELALWGLLAGSRRGSFRLLSLGGFCAGLGVVVRPYDALLLLAPMAGWLLWRAAEHRLRFLGGVAAGAAVPGLGLLWFDAAATGSPLHLPFSLFSSGDTLGFGVHRMYPGEAARHFGLSQGWQGLARHLSLLGGGWALGGIVLAVLAGVGLSRGRPPAATVVILVGGLLLTVGYLFFWGTWNAAILWGAVRYLGPYYLLPLLLPLSILGALGLRGIAAGGTWKAVFTGVVAVGVSGVTLGPALAADSALNNQNMRLASAVAAQGRSLVFVDTYPSYLQHPTAVISNPVPPGGRAVYALSRGGDDFAVVSGFPGRRRYRLRLLGEYGKHPHSGYGARLERISLISGATLRLRVSAIVPHSETTARLLVSLGSRRVGWALSPRRTDTFQLTFAVAATGSRPLPAGTISGVRPGSDHAVSLSLVARGGDGRDRVLDKLRLPLDRTIGGQLSMLAPSGLVAELGPLPRPALDVVGFSVTP